MIKTLVFFLPVFGLLSACSSKPLRGENPSKHHFVDRTSTALPRISGQILQAFFAPLNHDKRVDLVLLVRLKNGRKEIQVFLNQGKGKFSFQKNAHLEGGPREDIQFVLVRDFTGDRIADVVRVIRSQGKLMVRMFTNNKKGYFFEDPQGARLPDLQNGIERGDAVDIDRDGDFDLFFTGRRVVDAQNRPSRYQAQIFINEGHGRLRDLTSALVPPLRGGIAGAVFADYDGDAQPDVFLIYEKGNNALLINNGLGKFMDYSGRSLPDVRARTTHADWADFDGDKDNDLLVVTVGIDDSYRNYPSEFCYVLENDGKGRFRRRPLRILPSIPSLRVYLLDADENDTVDIIVLTRKGPYFFAGVGKWAFAQETRKRLPFFTPIKEMTFADVNGDGYLDIFSIIDKNKRGRLWVSSFD